MTQEEIKNLIGYKEDRVQVLNSKKQSLIDLENQISKSKFKQTVQSAFYTIKNFFLMCLLLVTLLIAVVGLIYPNRFLHTKVTIFHRRCILVLNLIA